MSHLLTAGIALITAITSFWGMYNHMPLSWIDASKNEKLGGTSITTILGSDTLSNSRTTINNNFSSLNTNKVEIEDLSSTTTLPSLTTLTSLSSVGTITSGIWRGTIVEGSYGGTGSSSLASNYVMLGNGTSGLKTVSGLGTSGQLLQSQGTGLPPVWATVETNPASNYVWTGTHLFTASTTFTGTTTVMANSVNNALVLNGKPYVFPSTEGASSTMLSTNGSGRLSWSAIKLPMLLASSSMITVGDNPASERTIFSTTVPGNTLSTTNAIRLKLQIDEFDFDHTISGTSNTFVLRLKYGATTMITITLTSAATAAADNMIGHIEAVIMANNSASSQSARMEIIAQQGVTTAGSFPIGVRTFTTGSASIDSTADQTLTLTGQFSNNDDTMQLVTSNVVVERLMTGN